MRRTLWVWVLCLGCSDPGTVEMDTDGSVDFDSAVDAGPRPDSTLPPPDVDPIDPPPPSSDGLFGCPTVAAPEYTGLRGAPSSWDDSVRADVRTTGLRAWREPDELGASCADCHGFDGLDLAVLGLTDADFRRRGVDHVPPESVEAIVDLVHLLREEMSITAPCSLEWRVFQPGGETIAGDTVLERELAFGESLQEMGFAIASDEPIQTAEDALRVYSELAHAPIRHMPIPVPLPRWSDDHARGAQYRNINDWVTDHGIIAREGQRDAWYALHDAYLADPSEENLFATIRGIEELMEPLPLREHQTITRFINKLNDERYITALLAQHLFRMELTGGEGWNEFGPVAFDLRYDIRFKSPGDHSQLNGLNAFSALQGVSHLSGTACDRRDHPDENVSVDCLMPLPQGMIDELSPSESIWDDDAFGSYSPTWGVLGWLWDASMMDTARHSNNMKYWKSELRRREYDLFLIWMRATAFATKMNVVANTNGPIRPAPEEPCPRIVDGRWWRHFYVVEANRLERGDEWNERNLMAQHVSLRLHLSTLLIMEELLRSGSAINDRATLESEMAYAAEEIADYDLPDDQVNAVLEAHARVADLVASADATDVITVY